MVFWGLWVCEWGGGGLSGLGLEGLPELFLASSDEKASLEWNSSNDHPLMILTGHPQYRSV